MRGGREGGTAEGWRQARAWSLGGQQFRIFGGWICAKYNLRQGRTRLAFFFKDNFATIKKLVGKREDG